MNADAPGLTEREFNPQEYLNTLLADPAQRAAAESYDSSPDRLHNDKTPNLGIVREKPEHRIVIWLKAQGKSNTEIARLTGMTQPWVSQILRQPWARQRVLDIIKEAGLDEVQQLLASTTVDSIYTLIEVRDSSTAKPSERAAAANALLDRVLGKPVQRMESDVTHRSVAAEVQEVDEQLKGVEEELRRFGANPGNN